MNGRYFLSTVLLLTLFPLSVGNSLTAPVDPRVLAVVQRMESAFKSVEDYTCEVEQIFYKDGTEYERSRFRVYFKSRGVGSPVVPTPNHGLIKPDQERNKKIRVDFTHPHPSLTLIYVEGEDKATVIPFRSTPFLRFRLSINDSVLKTRAGQRIDQTGMDYFIRFALKNLESTGQGESEFQENEEEAVFFLWALDYISGKTLEKYRVHLSKRIWLPTRIERYDLKDNALEITMIKNYAINTRLDDSLFQP